MEIRARHPLERQQHVWLVTVAIGHDGFRELTRAAMIGQSVAGVDCDRRCLRSGARCHEGDIVAALMQVRSNCQAIAFLAAERFKLKDSECDLHRFRPGEPVAASFDYSIAVWCANHPRRQNALWQALFKANECALPPDAAREQVTAWQARQCGSARARV